MQPNDDRPTTPVVPQRNSYLHVTPRQAATDDDAKTAAAANIVRGQIDDIYQSDPNATAPAEAPAPHGAVDYKPAQPAASNPDAPNPYERTHDETAHQVNQTAWGRYHSAWQNYYQQYYERYYVGQVYETKQQLEQQAAAQKANAPLTEAEAMYELRNDLIGKVHARAAKVRKSRHFWPIVSAVTVMLLFLVLQYNRIAISYVSAYVSPGNVSPANIIVNPADTSAVTDDDRLIIPSINVDVPIIWDANAASQDSLNAAMDKGVAWFNVQQAHSRPGENGNLVISGHSSNDWLDKGDYKYIFAPLERMKAGDTFYINYQKKRYVYKVTHMTVVKPTDVNALQTDNSKPVATLITCTPLGTALNRLLVFADQISPDPTKAAAAPTDTSSSNSTQMPTNSPTFLERLFGGN